MTDAELLELLLRHAGGNAAEQARQLTEFFPNLAAIFEASPEDLRTVEGIDDEAILLLRLVPELHRRYFLSRAHVERVLLDSVLRRVSAAVFLRRAGRDALSALS